MVCNGIVAHSIEELQEKAAAAKAAKADKQDDKAQENKDKATTKGGKK